jgi:ankyrin repeat protein
MSLMKKWARSLASVTGLLVGLILQLQTTQAQSKNDPQFDSSVVDMSELIARGDNLRLIEQLRNKADPNGQNGEGISLLLVAWQARQRRAFDILLEAGADLHQTSSKDVVLKVDEQELLLQAGSSVAFTAMQYSYWRPEFVELVLRYLKRPNQRNNQQETILHTLVSNHRIRLDKRFDSCFNNPANYHLGEIAVILAVNAGVEINAFDKDGEIVLNYLVPREPVSQELLSEVRRLPAFYIIEKNISSSAMSLISLGANPDLKSRGGTSYVEEITRFAQTNLEFSATRSFAKSLENRFPMEQKRSRIENRPSLGYSAFYRMFDEDTNNEICNSIQDGPGALYQLVSNRPVPIPPQLTRPFNDLVAIGFEPNASGKGGFTFLWAAMLATKEAEFKKLIELGANLDLKLSRNLWDSGESFGDRSVEEKSRARRGYNFWPDKGDTVLMAACLNPFRRKQFIEPALAATKDPNQRDELERNLLHLLLYHPLLEGQEVFVDKLIQAGVDVNARTIGGATPSHVAVGMNPSVIPTLIKAGADLEIRDLRGRTVHDLLKLAILEDWGSKDECVRIIESGSLKKN